MKIFWGILRRVILPISVFIASVSMAMAGDWTDALINIMILIVYMEVVK